MKPILVEGHPYNCVLLLRSLLQSLVAFDRQFDTFNKIRSYLDTAVSPFYFLANGPRELLDNISDTLARRDQLLFENKALKKEVLLKKQIIYYLDNLNRKTLDYVSYWGHLYVRMNT